MSHLTILIAHSLQAQADSHTFALNEALEAARSSWMESLLPKELSRAYTGKGFPITRELAKWAIFINT